MQQFVNNNKNDIININNNSGNYNNLKHHINCFVTHKLKPGANIQEVFFFNYFFIDVLSIQSSTVDFV